MSRKIRFYEHKNLTKFIMSTCNFTNKNASKIYAVIIPEKFYCLDCDYEGKDLQDVNKHGDENSHNTGNVDLDLEYEDATTNLVDELSDLPEAMVYDEPFRVTGAESLVSLEMAKEFKDCTANAYLTVVVRNGYFEGINFDYELDTGGDYDMLEGKRYDRAVKWIEKSQKAMAKKVEKIFAKHSTPLKVKSRASNGECWYIKA